ncbi:hypothetical protein Hanom_Chr09g00794991 [Helianthus anomalus]
MIDGGDAVVVRGDYAVAVGGLMWTTNGGREMSLVCCVSIYMPSIEYLSLITVRVRYISESPSHQFQRKPAARRPIRVKSGSVRF